MKTLISILLLVFLLFISCQKDRMIDRNGILWDYNYIQSLGFKTFDTTYQNVIKSGYLIDNISIDLNQALIKPNNVDRVEYWIWYWKNDTLSVKTIDNIFNPTLFNFSRPNKNTFNFYITAECYNKDDGRFRSLYSLAFYDEK